MWNEILFSAISLGIQKLRRNGNRKEGERETGEKEEESEDRQVEQTRVTDKKGC